MEERDPMKLIETISGKFLDHHDYKGKAEAEIKVGELSPLVWAYVGDCVYELFIRTFLVFDKRRKLHKIHDEAVKYVNSSAQSAIVHAIEPFLNSEEKEIVLKGRNTKSNLPRSSNAVEYRYSTGLEALIGYLYLTGKLDRLNEILYIILNNLDCIEAGTSK